MKKCFKKIFIINLVICCIINILSTYAYADLITVKLEISCKDDVLHSETISAINSELRRLGDIYITNGFNADFTINIIAMETMNVNGKITGIAYSTIVLKPFDNRFFISILPKECFQNNNKKNDKNKHSNKLSKEDREFLSKVQKGIDEFDDHNKDNVQYIRQAFWLKMTDNLLKLDNHFINTGARNDVQDICRSIIAMIDASSFEKYRAEKRY